VPHCVPFDPTFPLVQGSHTEFVIRKDGINYYSESGHTHDSESNPVFAVWYKLPTDQYRTNMTFYGVDCWQNLVWRVAQTTANSRFEALPQALNHNMTPASSCQIYNFHNSIFPWGITARRICGDHRLGSRRACRRTSRPRRPPGVPATPSKSTVAP
jgi:hypothetical protein